MCCIETTPVIGTERLALRDLCRADADRIATLANDADVVRMTSSMPYPYHLVDAHAFLDHVADAEGERTFAIDHPDQGLIGVLGFTPGPYGGAEIGYWLGRDYWGQGFATEAATAGLGWAARSWRRKLVVAGHFVDNPASGEVLCKAGFLYTGEVQPRYSRARDAEAPTRMMVWLA